MLVPNSWKIIPSHSSLLRPLSLGLRRHSSARKDEKHDKPRVSTNIRNIGIVAHIDAGKTTVTERLLYISGLTRTMGDVDSGNTVTDFLDMERERGITIQSAAVTFNWRKHHINLIDTPGHVDFTVEVERCARVLDGVVAVLDGSAGVQAQTLTVWKQASKFRLPAVFYVNKLDKKSANFKHTMDSIEQKLGVKGLPIVVPYYSEGSLSGVVDLLNKKSLLIGSTETQWEDIKSNSLCDEVLSEARETLCYTLAEHDHEFMSLFLDKYDGDVDKLPHKDLIQVLRRLTLSGKCATVSCGSALRSAASVRPILEQTVDCLPSPDERNQILKQLFGDDLSALVFKITHDKRKGQLSYIRVYTGELRNNSSVFNSNRCLNEGPIKVFIPNSDELMPATHVSEGNIAIISGLSSTITGDTLLSSETAGHRIAHERHRLVYDEKVQQRDKCQKNAHKVFQIPYHNEHLGVLVKGDGQNVIFAGIDVPEPVFFCSVEPPNAGGVNDLEKALKELAVEDPSLRVRVDGSTGQTVVETMGELHMEVIKDRLVRGYGLNVFVGPLQIGYREMMMGSAVHTCLVQDTGDKSRCQSVSLTLDIQAKSGTGMFKKVLLDLPPDSYRLRMEWQKAINEGCHNAFHSGPILGFPIYGASVTLKNITTSGGKINPVLLSSCAQKCVSEIMQIAGVQLAEPLMKIDVSLDTDESSQPILQELTQRRANINVCERKQGGFMIITAQMPLSEVPGLSRAIRILSSGFASLHFQVSDYQFVPENELPAIVSRIRG